MKQELNQTPRANRVHIGFFGRRNAGKSSLVNAITGQTISIVSDIRGTTTDPVEKAMELLPIGPVVIIDTPGLDDVGTLGEMRIQRTLQTLSHTDFAVLVLDASVGITSHDEEFQKRLAERHIPYLLVWNKADVAPERTLSPAGIPVSAKTGSGIDTLKEQLIALFQKSIIDKPERSIFGNALKPNDIIILVTPIDASAPKGRMILPQVQAIRDILDQTAICMVTQPEQLSHALAMLKSPPKLVVTDSQAFAQVKQIVPDSIPLTSFSILFARFKGVLAPAIEAVKQLEHLPDGSRILISEGCTHHRQCNDIGTKKLPHWIQKHTGKSFEFYFTSGNTFPADLSPFCFIIHCGGCMLTQREMESRAGSAASQGVPYTNYGVLIAYLHGVYARSLSFLEQSDDLSLS